MRSMAKVHFMLAVAILTLGCGPDFTGVEATLNGDAGSSGMSSEPVPVTKHTGGSSAIRESSVGGSGRAAEDLETGGFGTAGNAGVSNVSGSSSTGGLPETTEGGSAGVPGTATGGVPDSSTGGANNASGGSSKSSGGSSGESTGGVSGHSTGGTLESVGGSSEVSTGGTKASTGGVPSATGGSPVEATGGTFDETGGFSEATGGVPSETGGTSGSTGGAAPSSVCIPNQTSCDGNTLRTCSSDGLSISEEVCPVGCADGACYGVCEPGITECDGIDLATCNSDGEWDYSDCLFSCLEGACSGECVPGDTQCSTDGSALTCTDLGVWELEEECQFVCTDGACTGSCDPKNTQCADGTVQTCSASGNWEHSEVCPFVCTNGACSGECAPGEVGCDGTAVITCDSAGSWVETEVCPAICEDGACTGDCAPGTTQCNGIELQLCDSDASWTHTTDCPYACDAGACTGICVPGDTRCADGTTVENCNNLGQWTSSEVCPFVCIDGACDGECVPGETRCSDEVSLETCGTDGYWTAPEACPEAEWGMGQEAVCSAGVCGVQCFENSEDCDGDPSNGCEAFLDTDELNCRECGHSCDGTPCTDYMCGSKTVYWAPDGTQIDVPSLAVSPNGDLHWSQSDGSVRNMSGILASNQGYAHRLSFAENGDLCWMATATILGQTQTAIRCRETSLYEPVALGSLTQADAVKMVATNDYVFVGMGFVDRFDRDTGDKVEFRPVGTETNFYRVHEGFLYTARSLNVNDIVRQPIEGGSVETVVDNQDNIWFMEIHGDYLTWFNHGGGYSLWSLNLVTGDRHELLTGIPIGSFDSDSEFAYYHPSNTSGLYRVPLNGGDPQQIATANPSNFIVSDSHIYWVTNPYERINQVVK